MDYLFTAVAAVAAWEGAKWAWGKYVAPKLAKIKADLEA